MSKKWKQSEFTYFKKKVYNDIGMKALEDLTTQINIENLGLDFDEVKICGEIGKNNVGIRKVMFGGNKEVKAIRILIRKICNTISKNGFIYQKKDKTFALVLKNHILEKDKDKMLGVSKNFDKELIKYRDDNSILFFKIEHRILKKKISI